MKNNEKVTFKQSLKNNKFILKSSRGLAQYSFVLIFNIFGNKLFVSF